MSDGADRPQARRPRPRPDGVDEAVDHVPPAPIAEPGPHPKRGALTWALRVVSVLLVAAGITVFAVARHDRDAPASASPTTGAASDPRARLDDPAAAQGFVSAAATEVVAVTQSDYRRLDDTLQAGLEVTTGAFRTRFQQALTGSAAQQRRAHRSTTDLEVLASGIGEMNAAATTAKVLVFGRVTQGGTDIATSARTVVTTLCVTVVRRGQQYLISNLASDANAGVPPGTSGLRAAAAAAGAAVLDTLTFSRTSFTSDLVRARTSATGQLLTSIGNSSAATLKRMQKGGYDLAGRLTAVALQQTSDDVAVFLVGAVGSRVADSGATTTDVNGHYAVTVQRVGTSTWLASAITSIGSS